MHGLNIISRLAVITRPPDGVLLGARCSAQAPRLITRAVISRRPDGVS